MFNCLADVCSFLSWIEMDSDGIKINGEKSEISLYVEQKASKCLLYLAWTSEVMFE